MPLAAIPERDAAQLAHSQPALLTAEVGRVLEQRDHAMHYPLARDVLLGGQLRFLDQQHGRAQLAEVVPQAQELAPEAERIAGQEFDVRERIEGHAARRRWLVVSKIS